MMRSSRYPPRCRTRARSEEAQAPEAMSQAVLKGERSLTTAATLDAAALPRSAARLLELATSFQCYTGRSQKREDRAIQAQVGQAGARGVIPLGARLLRSCADSRSSEAHLLG